MKALRFRCLFAVMTIVAGCVEEEDYSSATNGNKSVSLLSQTEVPIPKDVSYTIIKKHVLLDIIDTQVMNGAIDRKFGGSEERMFEVGILALLI